MTNLKDKGTLLVWGIWPCLENVLEMFTEHLRRNWDEKVGCTKKHKPSAAKTPAREHAFYGNYQYKFGLMTKWGDLNFILGCFTDAESSEPSPEWSHRKRSHCSTEQTSYGIEYERKTHSGTRTLPKIQRKRRRTTQTKPTKTPSFWKICNPSPWKNKFSLKPKRPKKNLSLSL